MGFPGGAMATLVSASRFSAAALARFVIAAAVAALAASSESSAQAPEPIRSLADEVPRILAQMQNLVARERMTQIVYDTASERVVRRRVLASDYQIAPLDAEPDALWEFRFVREVDGRPVPGADRQIEDFLRLRDRASLEERMRVTELGLARSLPGCYWHNLTLVLRAFEGPNVEQFEWRRRGDSWLFEQVRGPGIPDNAFDPRSARHYPHGSLTLSRGSLSRVDFEWTSGGLVTSVAMDFTPPAEPDRIPRPLKYVARTHAASSSRPLSQTTFEYGDYRRFGVQTESAAAPPGAL
jgi:hypothetical protein